MPPLTRFTALAAATLPLLSAAESPDPKAVLQDLRSFANTGTVLHVGAHPDDENTELITYLSRGRGYRMAYLSLTRGDGGQNELGKDFDEKLGVLRTQELIAARKIDGGRQFFTRAIDFGFSKNPEETLKFWNREQVLADVVRIYRQFRPDVVVTRFPIPPGSGGHGHHTASGILAVEAFKISGDPNAYPEQIKEGLRPWQPKRVLWNSFRIGAAGPGSLDGPVHRQDIGGKDPVTGEEFGTIAAKSRSQHGTQGLFGAANRARTGANEQAFMLLAGEPVAGSDLMDGVDTSWNRYPGGAEIQALADQLVAAFNPSDLDANVPAILELRRKLAALPGDAVVADKRRQLDGILQACLGLTVEMVLDEAEFVVGENPMHTRTTSLRANRTVVRVVGGGLSSRDEIRPGQPLVERSALQGPAIDAQPVTHPYWLRAEGSSGISRVDDARLIGLPEEVTRVSQTFEVDGQQFQVTSELLHRTAGGELRRVAVVPPVSLRLDAEVLMVAPGAAKPVQVEVTAARADTMGAVRLEVPAGWKLSPAKHDFRIPSAGGKARFSFEVTAPAQPASGRVLAVAEVRGRPYSHQRLELRYDHLPAQLLQPPARARLVAADVAIEARHIGFLPGAGDSADEALAQLGCDIRVLSGADLTPEKLAGLDAVVIGVRAFNERNDLKAAFPGLLAWVEQGGTVVAQYNRPNGLLADRLGPYELSIQGPAPQNRVTDETAAVSFLAPDHPALNVPNKITAADFSGWVQERGAYFPSKWDEANYVALLAMNDPGETQPHSSVLVAQHGRGYYVYTSLAFFRQLPAGVPGAYRLLANLVSLGK
ncbi:MAG TPA: PIG-L family deacetylase [Opitutaceae bacterium]|nr:PIG-L family deacetylase [Opitutaceae bacterium]